MNYEQFFVSDYALNDPVRTAVASSTMSMYFKRYLIQKAMAVFKWTFPGTWNDAYTLYNLYIMGRVAIIDAGEKYGIIPQYCTLSGRGVFMQPTRVLI